MNRKTPIIGRVRCCLELVRSTTLKEKVLLDVGSTFGWLEKELDKDELKKIIGIEPNEGALQIARKEAPKADFFKASAERIPVKDSSIDVATFFDVIEHVPVGSETHVLKEINRTLRQKGLLLLSTPNNHWLANILDPAWLLGHRHYSRKSLDTLLISSGFEIETCETKGGVISLLALITFYLFKWVLKIPESPNWLNQLDDQSYNGRGLATIFIKAKKIKD